MALKVLHTITKEQEERWRQISEEKYELDMRSTIEYEKEKSEKKGRLEIIEMLKNGKSPEEIIKEYSSRS